jgi:hypothetical protein
MSKVVGRSHSSTVCEMRLFGLITAATLFYRLRSAPRASFDRFDTLCQFLQLPQSVPPLSLRK